LKKKISTLNEVYLKGIEKFLDKFMRTPLTMFVYPFKLNMTQIDEKK